MFVPFQRLGDTDNTTGVGLGLALSLGLTEAMGGTLTAEDTPGGGLTMTVSLPVVSGPGYAYEPGQPEPEALSEPKGRGAAWTEERRRSDEGRRVLKSAPEANGEVEP
jgi:two-component system sensor histidine kinase KdpD